jgi:hypothetical protein
VSDLTGRFHRGIQLNRWRYTFAAVEGSQRLQPLDEVRWIVKV